MTVWRIAVRLSAVSLATLALAAGVSAARAQQTPHTAAAKPALTRPAAKKPAAAAPRCDPATFRIVLDVGHTAEVPGAKSARGAVEYDYNLSLAKVIEHDLLAAGFARTTVMITAEPPRRGLFKRVREASQRDADFLLSIHHDSVPDAFLETWTYEGQEHQFSDRFRGHSLYISDGNVRRADSLAFAHLLGEGLKARGLHYATHYTLPIMGRKQRQLVDADAGVYRYDKLVVLRDSKMPAVLLEAGSIINRDEELLVGTPEYQALVSGAVVDAAKAYCAAPVRPAPGVVRRPQAPSAGGGPLQ